MKFSGIILFIILPADMYSQQAIDYFPQLGHKWNYRVSILDSSNNTIPEMIFFRDDSSAFLLEYNGKVAYHILSKTGTEETVQLLPYTDTNYIHLNGSDGYEYFKISEIEFLLSLINSSLLNNIIPYPGLVESFSGWHLNYRFAQNINQQYQITSFDTTVVIDTLEIPLRFNKTGRRLQNENLETEIGIFSCKKFVISSSINYLVILPPPLPPLPVPIITSVDTVWIAPGNWIVKYIIPSTNIDLTFLNLGDYNIPGLKREIISEVTGAEENTEEKFTFNLEQNYPNPFNPSTRIKFTIGNSGHVSIKVNDVLGKEVVILIDEELNRGNYETIFDGKDLSSGVYFYTFKFSDFYSGFNYSITKQMLLIK